MSDARLSEICEKVVAGVSFAPIYRDGETVRITLGREETGPFRNQLNFFGGALFEDISLAKRPYTSLQRALVIADTFFDEVLEEAGYLLTFEAWRASFLDVLEIPYQDTISLVFVHHMTGMNPETWGAIIDERFTKYKGGHLPYRFREMTDVSDLDILDPEESPSRFVNSAIEQLRAIVLPEEEPFSFGDLEDTRGYWLF